MRLLELIAIAVALTWTMRFSLRAELERAGIQRDDPPSESEGKDTQRPL